MEKVKTFSFFSDKFHMIHNQWEYNDKRYLGSVWKQISMPIFHSRRVANSKYTRVTLNTKSFISISLTPTVQRKINGFITGFVLRKHRTDKVTQQKLHIPGCENLPEDTSQLREHYKKHSDVENTAKANMIPDCQE
ncbi:mannitol-1-phosphate 5-dehydrogenase [Striga asiatica]|uniref:Mannitol-1-phosphate 5-dehydrogenase n=1 Tax=Striga asiatica TaxID=4170 RepID=A0A5A7PBW2_STRAF|nr:mannitol-1-phosphate 5-dehydrogenase [Striga asiatica]